MKKNCWEHKGCGREPGGANSDRGVCPAALETKMDGVHGGKNAGRTCWVVAGTHCGGEVQGSFAKKRGGCESCDFLRAVQDDERGRFLPSILLLRRLR